MTTLSGLSRVTRMMGTCHHTQFVLVEMMSHELFAWTSLEL
jgi:hypothetical protein